MWPYSERHTKPVPSLRRPRPRLWPRYGLSGSHRYELLFNIDSLFLFGVHFSFRFVVMIGITVVTTFSLSRLGHRFEKKTILGFGCITGMLTYSFFFWLPGKVIL